ncbi:MAG: FAD:protein FMN transferase [Bacteroidaceae bacterium]|nr:FAD:protein FMN transferase [Bacteroidaceae bacterium]
MKILGIEQIENNKPHKIKWWGWILLIILIVGTYIIYNQQHPNRKESSTAAWNQNELMKCEGMVFGTIYHITYQADKNMQKGIDETLTKVDNSLSPFNKNSIITAVNNGEDIKVNDMFTDVFNMAKYVAKETNGAFDITVAPLVNLWGFGFKNMSNVNEKTVDSLRQFVGFNNVELINGHVKKQYSETMLDCSAIAKGYGVDAVGKYLESQGIKNYMVEIGGEVRVRGLNPKGELWKIGVNKPIDDSTSVNSDIEQVIKITDMAMATSGNYRNFYIKDGKKYAHTIDPRTGYPVQHNILSSTVVAKDCATADAFATSFMVLGLEGAKEILKKHPEIRAFFICSKDDGTTEEWMSDNMKELILE